MHPEYRKQVVLPEEPDNHVRLRLATQVRGHFGHGAPAYLDVRVTQDVTAVGGTDLSDDVEDFIGLDVAEPIEDLGSRDRQGIRYRLAAG
jgi:hypothetical protein